MDKKFKDIEKYEELLNMGPKDTKKRFIALLRLRRGNVSRISDIENYKADIEDVISSHNRNTSNYMEFISDREDMIILGLELPGNYIPRKEDAMDSDEKPKYVNFYIGINFSRPLYKEKKWGKYSNIKNGLFEIVDIKEVEDEE